MAEKKSVHITAFTGSVEPMGVSYHTKNSPGDFVGEFGSHNGIPLGEYTNFAVLTSPESVGILHLVLFQDTNSKSPDFNIPMFLTGNTYHVTVHGLTANMCYAFCVNNKRIVSDPYARKILVRKTWGSFEETMQISRIPRCFLPIEEKFNWEGVTSPEIPLHECIIYEMHVRGFTRHPSSGVKYPGTFLGVIEKIPFLKNLGINVVELLPIQEFDELEFGHKKNSKGQQIYNYWGYSTDHFFVPMTRYGTPNEFRLMVRELHRMGIQVILDIVFNHTGGPTFKDLAENLYYTLHRNKHTNEDEHTNYSGCGNTFNCNEPNVSRFIVDVLEFWVKDMHVDGFRFDEAPILARDKGNLVDNCGLLHAIRRNKNLQNVKLISESWDAGGAYTLFSFGRQYHFSEWNGEFRDSVRNFIKGTDGSAPRFSQVLCGSKDLGAHDPVHVVNFVTCHDGFSLRDLVTYQNKNNHENAEGNRDGIDNNISWNCGIEGHTKNRAISDFRFQQMKNFVLALFLARGVPMICMGDEYGHTKNGNNNTYCQDNELNWYNWSEINGNHYFKFFSNAINFRKSFPFLSNNQFPNENEIEWHGRIPGKPEWDDSKNRLVAFVLKNIPSMDFLFVTFNMHHDAQQVQLPDSLNGDNGSFVWYKMIDTSAPPSEEFLPELQVLAQGSISVPPHTTVIYKAYFIV